MSGFVRRGMRARGRRVSARAGRWLVLVGLAFAFQFVSTAAGAAPPDPGATFFFDVSRIEAVPFPGLSATRYEVEVTNAPIGNTPYARWYLNLKPSASSGASCDNALLAGGERLSPTRYGWRNQGRSFVWYHGPADSYPADRSYGCDQAELGHGGYPGRVTVVLENDSQHCTATFAGVVTGSRPQYGPPAVCALGGYLPLPVPHALLGAYARVGSNLNALIQQVRAGKTPIGGAAFGRALETILEPQTKAFGKLFPPVWGCNFTAVFDPVLLAKSALETQIAELAGGGHVPRSALDEDARNMKATTGAVRACEPTASRPLGAPPGVVGRLDRLSAETDALRAQAGTGAIAPRRLRARLESIDAGLNALVGKSFPAVFGMPYRALLDRVLAESSMVASANRAATMGDRGGVVAALSRAAGNQRAITGSLRKEARQAAKAEKAA